MKIIEKEFNVATGLETITERDATPKEIQKIEAAQAEAAAIAAEAVEKEAARKAILEKLGLTNEEVKLLIS